MTDDEMIVKVSKVLDKGLVQIPLEKLDLQPGTRIIVYGTEDGVVLRKAERFFDMQTSRGLLRKIRGIFSKVPIRNIEEQRTEAVKSFKKKKEADMNYIRNRAQLGT